MAMASDQRLKMAFVGCGGIAQAHLRGIQRVAIRINVTAAVDTNAEAAAAMAAATGRTFVHGSRYRPGGR